MPQIQTTYNDFKSQIYDYVYHNDQLTEILFITLLLGGSILIEDLPGTGKTTLSKALSKLIGYGFGRVQGTSDITAQDIIGGEFYDFKTKEIEIRKGVIFSELLMIDEINRMNPKTQSAFLQAMEEKKVSILRQSFDLDPGFFVIATQNPIEHTGTFPLPEAQKDRFMSRVSIGNPYKELQIDIIMQNQISKLETGLQELGPILSKEDLKMHKEQIMQIEINELMAKKLYKFFENIRESEHILYSLSQRGISYFCNACRAKAYLEGREYVIPEDGVALIIPLLAHRLDINDNNTDILQKLYSRSISSFPGIS